MSQARFPLPWQPAGDVLQAANGMPVLRVAVDTRIHLNAARHAAHAVRCYHPLRDALTALIRDVQAGHTDPVTLAQALDALNLAQQGHAS